MLTSCEVMPSKRASHAAESTHHSRNSTPMKTLIFSLAAFLLTVTSYGQTLKWTHAIAQPPFNVDNTQLNSLRHDALGNLGFAIMYQNGVANAGAQFTWIAANGRVIFTINHIGAEGVIDPCVLSVTGTQFLTSFLRPDGLLTLRKYIKRPSGISHTDIVLGAREFVARNTFIDTAEGPFDSNFFAVALAQDQITPLTIKRYTVK